MKKLTLAVVATAVIGFAATASAAITPAAQGNLILGFDLANNNYNVEVDLGAESGFTTATTTETLTQLNSSDLSDFGGVTSGLTWSVQGTADGTGATAYNIEATSTSAPPSFSSRNQLQGPNGTIFNLTNAFGSEGVEGSNSSTAILGSSSDNANTDTDTYPYSYGNLEPTIQGSLRPTLQATGATTDELYALNR